MFLGKRGKNEVRLGYGQVGQVRLASLGRAFSPNTPRTHRNLRLNDLIPGALLVRVRVHKAGEPLSLVGLQNMPPYREHQAG